jgi:hypothetical protein
MLEITTIFYYQTGITEYLWILACFSKMYDFGVDMAYGNYMLYSVFK